VKADLSLVKLDVKTLTGDLAQVREDLHHFRDETFQRLDDLYKKFSDLNQEYIVIKEQLKRSDKTNDMIHEHQAALDVLRKRVAQLQIQVEDLEKRLNAH
jgi:predicted nuclease with TOPRIM domain